MSKEDFFFFSPTMKKRLKGSSISYHVLGEDK